MYYRTRLRYKKLEDGALRLIDEVIIRDQFFSAYITPDNTCYIITPTGTINGQATSPHKAKKRIKQYFQSQGARFKNEKRVKKNNE